MESALMTSPSRASASSTARSDFPAAVGPTMAISTSPARLAAAGGHAEQHRRGRGRLGSMLCGAPAGPPRVARPGAAHAQRRVVRAQVVRRGAGDAGGNDVAWTRSGLVRGEVHQAVVAGAAGHAVRGRVLAPLPLGDEDLDDGAV